MRVVRYSNFQSMADMQLHQYSSSYEATKGSGVEATVAGSRPRHAAGQRKGPPAEVGHPRGREFLVFLKQSIYTLNSP